jgi:hypothetical protein
LILAASQVLLAEQTAAGPAQGPAVTNASIFLVFPPTPKTKDQRRQSDVLSTRKATTLCQRLDSAAGRSRLPSPSPEALSMLAGAARDTFLSEGNAGAHQIGVAKLARRLISTMAKLPQSNASQLISLRTMGEALLLTVAAAFTAPQILPILHEVLPTFQFEEAEAFTLEKLALLPPEIVLTTGGLRFGPARASVWLLGTASSAAPDSLKAQQQSKGEVLEDALRHYLNGLCSGLGDNTASIL